MALRDSVKEMLLVLRSQVLIRLVRHSQVTLRWTWIQPSYSFEGDAFTPASSKEDANAIFGWVRGSADCTRRDSSHDRDGRSRGYELILDAKYVVRH